MYLLLPPPSLYGQHTRNANTVQWFTYIISCIARWMGIGKWMKATIDTDWECGRACALAKSILCFATKFTHQRRLITSKTIWRYLIVSYILTIIQWPQSVKKQNAPRLNQQPIGWPIIPRGITAWYSLRSASTYWFFYFYKANAQTHLLFSIWCIPFDILVAPHCEFDEMGTISQFAIWMGTTIEWRIKRKNDNKRHDFGDAVCTKIFMYFYCDRHHPFAMPDKANCI